MRGVAPWTAFARPLAGTSQLPPGVYRICRSPHKDRLPRYTGPSYIVHLMGRLLWVALLITAIIGVGLCSQLGLGTVPTAGGRAVAPSSQHDCPPTHPVKGTFNRRYHMPNDLFYAQTDPVACFMTAADATAAGYRAASH